MIATRRRMRTRAPLSAGLVVSALLHAALLAIVAAIPAGLVASRSAPTATSTAVALALVPVRDEPAAVVVYAAPLVPRDVPPPQQPQTIDVADIPALVTAAEPPDVVPDGPATPPAAADRGPSHPGPGRLGELAALRPGRGRAGRGSTGVGGGGGGTDGGDGGGSYGTLAGLGAGGDGAGTGWAARGGETRGPAIVGALAAPPYPAKARSRGWEGRVVLVLTIDEHGRVTSAEVAESSGRPALDDAAVDAALAWTLSPALHEGEPVAGTLRVPVRFELTD